MTSQRAMTVMKIYGYNRSQLDTGSGALATDVSLARTIGGQSNAIGGGGSNGGALSTVQPFSNTRWNRSLSQLDPLVETTVETPASALANWLTEQEQTPAPGRVSAVDNWAIGATAYLAMAGPTDVPPNGTANFQNAITALTGLYNALSAPRRLAAFHVIHGETDEANNTPQATYQTYLDNWQADMQASAQAATGATDRMPLILSQYSSHAQIGTGRSRSLIAPAQIEAARANPNISFACPTYFLPYQNNGSANIHYTNVGEQILGEYLARAEREEVILNRRWMGLHTDSASLVGNVATLQLSGGDGSPVVVDTTQMRERHNRGVCYEDGTASPAAVTSVAVNPDGRSLTVTLNKEGAASGVFYIGEISGGQAILGPTGNGPGTNIRDSDSTPNRVPGGHALQNWLALQRVAVGSYTAQGVVPPAWSNTQSLRLASSSQYVSVPEYTTTHGLQQATFAAWVHRDSAPGSTSAFFAQNLTNHRHFDFRVTNTRALQLFVATNLTTVVNGVTPVCFNVGAGVWNLVLIVCDLSNATNANRVLPYVNNVLQAIGTPPTWPTAFTSGALSELAIGAASNGGNGLNLANIRDVAIWPNFVPTLAQRGEIWNGGVPFDWSTVSWGAPAKYWRFNGDYADYGNTTPRHGTGFNGTSFGASVP